MTNLVLSLFPGIGMLDMAFEEVGFCIVRGPDLLWGGDIRQFHPPAGKFDGVIGGPPCKAFSPLANINRARYGDASIAPNLIPEYERVVRLTQPTWFLMENVPQAPLPWAAGYQVRDHVLNNRWLGETQNRVRRFSFGTRDGRRLPLRGCVLESAIFEPAVTSTAGGRRAVAVTTSEGRQLGKQGKSSSARLKNRSLGKLCELQGLSADFLQGSPFTADGRREVVANGVPLAMGRAVAEAVKRALSVSEVAA